MEQRLIFQYAQFISELLGTCCSNNKLELFDLKQEIVVYEGLSRVDQCSCEFFRLLMWFEL